eukprot:6207930-Pleurochrysis_carterae.AAC.2
MTAAGRAGAAVGRASLRGEQRARTAVPDAAGLAGQAVGILPLGPAAGTRFEQLRVCVCAVSYTHLTLPTILLV